MVARGWSRSVRIPASIGAFAAWACVTIVATLLPTTAHATDSDRDRPAGLAWGQSSIAGRQVRGLSGGPPLHLVPGEQPAVELAIVNEGQDTARPFEVRLTGRILGMAFFDYSTRIDAEVPPGQELGRTVEIELDDLEGKGVGLVPTTLSLRDEDGAVLLDESFPAEVEGPLTSAYGVFGLAIIGSTLVLLASLLLRIWRGMLPENRWRRALHFLPVGTGVGLTLTFGLSALGWLTPSGAWWATFVVVAAAVAFAIGYLLPMPFDEQDIPSAEPAREEQQ
jgi:hypothetical protein